ncbi:MAG: hypothetical protein KAJ11_15655, partial [Alphaproteobacteria bacterium]|nr:hypothetical protein [Alphaproteobacteria bacterium]
GLVFQESFQKRHCILLNKSWFKFSPANPTCNQAAPARTSLASPLLSPNNGVHGMTRMSQMADLLTVINYVF